MLVHLAQDAEIESPIRQALEPIAKREKRSALLKHERRFVVAGKETGTKRGEVDAIMARLEGIQVPEGGCDLHVRFQTPHAYAYGLCALAAWAAQNARSIRFEGEQRVGFFLERAGVIRALNDPQSEPVQFDGENHIGFTRVPAAGLRFDTDFHAGRFVALLRKHTDLDERAAEAMTIAFSELIENCIKHGNIASDAWLFANYHPKDRKMHICICDRGMGVQRSFLESENEVIRAIGEHPTRWIKECTEPFVTSKTKHHAGYGLYIVRELCKRNEGSFALLSGHAAYRFFHRPTSMSGSRYEEFIEKMPFAWRGTLLGMNFDLNRPLDIGTIYKNMPRVPRGYADDELDIFE